MEARRQAKSAGLITFILFFVICYLVIMEPWDISLRAFVLAIVYLFVEHNIPDKVKRFPVRVLISVTVVYEISKLINYIFY